MDTAFSARQVALALHPSVPRVIRCIRSLGLDVQRSPSSRLLLTESDLSDIRRHLGGGSEPAGVVAHRGQGAGRAQSSPGRADVREGRGAALRCISDRGRRRSGTPGRPRAGARRAPARGSGQCPRGADLAWRCRTQDRPVHPGGGGQARGSNARGDARAARTSLARPPGRGRAVRSLGGSGTVRRLAGLLARQRFDVVSAYGLRATMLCRVLVRALSPGTRFVSGVRGLHVFEVERVDSLASRLVLALERFASPLVDVYDVNSRGAEELLADAGVPRHKLRYIPNGIDPADWGTPPRTHGPTPTILCVARFTPVKRHLDLIAAASLLADEGIDLRLILVGDGPNLPECRAAATSVGDRVVFAGPVPRGDVKRVLSQADVFCLPSRWEGMPGSVMEAMAAGLPVVGTRVNGIEDLVIDGETGLLVLPLDPQALAAALRTLLEDFQMRRRMGEAGRDRIAEHFTLDGMLLAKEQLYRELAAA